jgi:NAD(P) transhydrogenase
MTMLRLVIGRHGLGSAIRVNPCLSSRFARSSAGSSLLFRTKTDDAKPEEPPKGIPYSKLTIGVPKETFPLERRVAATPEVS